MPAVVLNTSMPISRRIYLLFVSRKASHCILFLHSALVAAFHKGCSTDEAENKKRKQNNTGLSCRLTTISRHHPTCLQLSPSFGYCLTVFSYTLQTRILRCLQLSPSHMLAQILQSPSLFQRSVWELFHLNGGGIHQQERAVE